MYLLGCTILSANGPLLYQWSKWAPVVLWCLNINYSQTRKSGLSFLTEGQPCVWFNRHEPWAHQKSNLLNQRAICSPFFVPDTGCGGRGGQDTVAESMQS